jgi:hypothetical protein
MRLDLVDDVNEGEVSDIENYGRFLFVSCWSDNKKESIPMWGMSADDMCGIRIRLPKKPFYHYDSNDHLPTDKLPRNEPFPGSTIVNRLHLPNFVFIQSLNEHYEIKIKYTSDKNLLKPTLVESDNENNKTIWSSKVGTHKTKAWKFQQEVRYKIQTHPLSMFKPDKQEGTIANHQPTDRYIDVNIRDDAFEDMEILLGPKQTEAHKIIAQALIDKYNPVCKIRPSSLLIRQPQRF